MYNLLFLVPIVLSFYIMSMERNKIKAGEIDNSPLRGSLLVWVILLDFFAPLIGPSVFYYGWKKRMPKKAKLANDIGWIFFLLIIVLAIYLGYK